jgi:hypothetical protein
MGREKKVARILEDTIETSKLGFFPVNGNIAILYFLLGNKELGFLHLERAVENKEHSIRELKISPLFDGVRSDPRFQPLLQKMGLD